MACPVWPSPLADGADWIVWAPKDVAADFRVPDALTIAFPALFPSASAARRACRNKGGPHAALLDGAAARCESVVVGGAELRVKPRSRPEAALEVLFEDEHVAVVRKPPGVVVHGAGGGSLACRLEKLGAVPCHRLDGPTEGLVACGKSELARRELHRQFADREVSKRYCAVVHGHLPREGRVSAEVEGRPATTEWRVRWSGHSPTFGPLSCVDLWPVTGRKHQLRRHLAEELHSPILGDVRYCEAMRTRRGAPLLLASMEIGFAHPETGEAVTVTMAEPPRFRQLELLPDASDAKLMPAVVQAGQKQSEAWKALWTDHCRSFEDQKDPHKHTADSLRSFLSGVRAEFKSATWMPATLQEELAADQPERT